MAATQLKRKARGRGRKAGQISIPPGKWLLAEIMVEKGLFKDVSAIFEKAFDDLADKCGLALKVEVEEIGSKTKPR